MRGKSLTCQLRGTDEAGRRLGQCFDGTLDINAELVRLGAAWADKSDSGGYRALEAKARDAKAGVWRGPSEPPWAWKEKLWTEAKHKAPDGCPIKGLIAGREKTYHMPWSPEYDRIKISQTSRSRRWFCSEAQAIAAGYKAQRGS